ncbi:hopanoid biosynthesis-associated protein HpnK [Nitrospira sp. Kam-Ns4a]
MRRIIVTGDDFGLARPVNEAIEEAHRRGILTAASLMVGAPAAEDAVERAKQLPTLKVGLHLVLVEGRPVLPPEAVPDLVDASGEFSTRLVAAGVRFVVRPGVRRQLEAEIRAQFEAFRRTGLDLDHVNAHNHMHLHPTVMRLLLTVGKDYGLKAVRLPYEPPLASWRAAGGGLGGRLLHTLALAPWTWLLRRRLARVGLRFNDYVLGLHDSGRLSPQLVSRFIQEAPDGVTEMYFHPATGRCPELERHQPDYQHRLELEALVSPSVREAFAASGAQRLAFSDL